MPMLESQRFALVAWLDEVEKWLSRIGVDVAELRALWEEVTPTTPPDAGAT